MGSILMVNACGLNKSLFNSGISIIFRMRLFASVRFFASGSSNNRLGRIGRDGGSCNVRVGRGGVLGAFILGCCIVFKDVKS